MFSDVLELIPTTTITYIIFDKMEHVTDSFSCFMSKHLSCFATQKSFRLTQTFELKEIKLINIVKLSLIILAVQS